MTSALPWRVAQKTGCCRICLLRRHSGSQLLHAEDSEDGVVITTESEDEVDGTTGVQNDVDVPTALITSSTLEPDAANVMDDMVGEPTTLRQVLGQDRVESVDYDCAPRSLANKNVAVCSHWKAE